MSTFDDRAREWDDKPGRREHAKRVAAAIADALRDATVHDVLEIGGGTGLLASELTAALPHPVSLTLTDTSAGMRAVAQDKVDAGELRADILDRDLSLDSPDDLAERFDLVVTHMVLHHVDDVSTLLRHARATLRPGGTFVALDLTPAGSDFHDHRAHEHTPSGGDPHYHHEGFGEAELRRHLADAGFVDVTYDEPLTVTREREGVEREFPLFLVVAR